MTKIFITLFSPIVLSACITSTTIPPEQRPQHWGTQIEVQHNFYQISPSLYRSEQPDAALSPLLEQHGIRRIINLRQRNRDLALFNPAQYRIDHIPVSAWAMQRQNILDVMKSIQDAEKKNEKVLIHCYHGSDRTGASVAMYRIIFQNWSREDALAEMKGGGYGFHPIWINIEKIFSAENILWIRQQLALYNQQPLQQPKTSSH